MPSIDSSAFTVILGTIAAFILYFLCRRVFHAYDRLCGLGAVFVSIPAAFTIRSGATALNYVIMAVGVVLIAVSLFRRDE
jgi:hypothetical protein